MIDFIIDKIQLRNVRCYGDDVMEMDFPVNNLTVFTGKVGSGKSTILKAVSMALYGEDGGAKGEKLSIDDMVNEKNGKNLEIHLYLHSVEGDNIQHKYEIHLFHKHNKYSNKLVFVKDGVDISLESKTATYELIEKTFIPKNVYHNIYYFTQQAKNFFTALPNTEQKEIFNSIMDLKEYAEYYENTKKKISEVELELVKLTSNQENIRSSLNDIKADIGSQITAYENKVESDKQVLADIETEIDNLERDKLTCEFNISECGNIDDLNNKLKDVEVERAKEINNIDNQILLSNNEIKQLNDGLQLTIGRLKSEAVAKRSEETKELFMKETEIKSHVAELNNKLNSSRDGMLSDRDNEISKVKLEYSNRLSEIKSELNELSNQINSNESFKVNELKDLQECARSKVDVIKEENNSYNLKNSTLCTEKGHVDKQCHEKRESLSEYEASLLSDDAVCKLCGQKLVNKDHVKKHIVVLKDEIDILDKKSKEFEVLIEDNQSKIEANNSKMKDIVSDFESKKQEIISKYNEIVLSIKKKKDDVQNSINDIENELSKKILDIEQEFDVLVKKLESSIQEDIKSFNSTLSDIATQKENIDNRIRSEYKVEYSKLVQSNESSIGEINKRIEKLNSDKLEKQNFYKLKCDELNTVIVNLKHAIDTKKSIEQYIESCNQKISFMKNSDYYSLYTTNISNSKERYRLKNEELDVVNKKINDTNRKIEILQFWKTAFSGTGIKSMLLDAAIPHMNECVAEELDKVAPGVFTVSFDTLSETKGGKIKDKFSINIVNNVEGCTGHKKLSGGQKRIIDLCCMCALRSLAEKLYNKRFHHIFYDEILDSLDDEYKQEFCVNSKRQTNECNVTLVTHDLPQDCDPDRVFPF